MMLCIFPDCTDGDTSMEAYEACDLCSLRPRQQDYHVRAFRTAQLRAELGRALTP
jgi:hypothetical protein